MSESEADETLHFTERKETVMVSPLPSLISAKKVVIRRSSNETDTQTSSTVDPKGEGSGHELQRSEVNVEVKGFRETVLSSSTTVVTNTVRTVYERTSSSGGSVNSDGGDAIEGPDSAFSEESATSQDMSQRERLTSTERHYISQTYQIGTSAQYMDSPSKSVSAVENVKFKTSKEFTLGDHHGGDNGKLDDELARFVERHEETISPRIPKTLSSPTKQGAQAFPNENEETEDISNMMQSVKEDVQQMIESSYRVSDITGVIDNDMSPKEQRKSIPGFDAESDIYPSEESQTSIKIDNDTSTVESHTESSAIDIPPSPLWKSVNSGDRIDQNGTLDRLSTDSITMGKKEESPPRLAYSPGVAIRSYALEELEEKKRSTPDRIEDEAKSLRYDAESSEVDMNTGTPVDSLNSLQYAQLNKVDLDKVKTTENSVERTSTHDVQMFKLTKVHKVTLAEETSYFEPPKYSTTDLTQTETDEERREAEDTLESLVDINSLQIGYKFHDVGMMQGFYNPAFDDEENDATSTSVTQSTEQATTSIFSQAPASIESKRQGVSKPTSLLSAQLEKYEKEHPQVAKEQEDNARTLSSSDVTQQVTSQESSSQSIEGGNVAMIAREVQSLTTSSQIVVDGEDRTVSISGDQTATTTAEKAGLLASSVTSSPSATTTLEGKQTEMQSAQTTSQQIVTTEIGHETLQSISADVSGPVSLKPTQPSQSISESKATTTVVAKPQPLPVVSVTRRFNVGPKFESSLKSKGATLQEETLYVDVYYDTPSFELTLSDCWLRTHNGRWQFHSGFTKLLNENTADQYREIEDQDLILQALGTVLNDASLSTTGSVSRAAQSLGLREFVRYKTTRKVYTMGELRIELQQPEYGFWVGQVTGTLPGRPSDAVESIGDFWKTTGAEPLSLVKG